MYALIWRLLPGPVPAKLVQALVLVGLLVWFLLSVVFPAVTPHLPLDQVVVG
jgi:hypothetical protein